MLTIPKTDLRVFPLCLGGNVFGGTATEEESFSVLDAYREGGGNFIDTADAYSAYIPGNHGGESEGVIGRWLASRQARGKVLIATKVGKLPGFSGLSAQSIERAAEASLRRLGIDVIDLYYAHADDPTVPLAETLTAFDKLIKQGKVRYIAASNYSAPRLKAALETSDRLGLARFVALQPHYNLVERGAYEGPLATLCAREELAVFPYYGLAGGFLTGKYRPGVAVHSQRAASASRYLDERGLKVLAALDRVAAAHSAPVSAVALAWLRAQATITAPIASARTLEQVPDLLLSARLTLREDELQTLSEASA